MHQKLNTRKPAGIRRLGTWRGPADTVFEGRFQRRSGDLNFNQLVSEGRIDNTSPGRDPSRGHERVGANRAAVHQPDVRHQNLAKRVGDEVAVSSRACDSPLRASSATLEVPTRVDKLVSKFAYLR